MPCGARVSRVIQSEPRLYIYTNGQTLSAVRNMPVWIYTSPYSLCCGLVPAALV